MPRGFPKDKNVKPFQKKVLGNNSDNVDTAPNLVLADLEQQKTEAKAPKAKIDEVNDPEYTTSPDGKYKFLKPKSVNHADLLEETSTNIPYFTRPGYIIVWPHDAKPSYIPSYIARGYEFVDPNTPGCENAIQQPLAGILKVDGSPARHYAMQISEEKFKEMKRIEQRKRDDFEAELKLKPSEKSDNIYGTGQTEYSKAYAKATNR